MTTRTLRRAFAVLLLASCGAASANQVLPDENLNLELRDASLSETLRTFAAIGGLGFDMEDGFEADVTIDLENVPYSQALDQVCRDHGAYCETVPGTPGTLRVRRADLTVHPARPAGLAESINMHLERADLVQVFASFAAITGRAIDVTKGIAGAVSVDLEKVPWPRVLDEVCRLNRCRVSWSEGGARIVPAEEGDVELLDLSLAGAPVGVVLASLVEIPLFGTAGTVVAVDPEVTGEVTVDLSNVTWQEALDQVCAQAGCAWTYVFGDPPTLKVFPRSEDTVKTSGVVPPGAPPVRLGYRLAVPGASPSAGTASFSWADPVYDVAASATTAARLLWLPFGAEVQAVMPLLLRCPDGPVTAFEPVVLPLIEPRLFEDGGTRLELLPAKDGAPRSMTQKLACGEEADGVEVTVRRRQPADGPPPSERRFVLERWLLVTPVGAHRPAAALVDLGVSQDGHRKLALLEPTADGVAVEHLAFERGGVFERVVKSGGETFDLRLSW